MSNPEKFEPFPKLKRMRKEKMIVTEKIDGTNAQVCIYQTLPATYEETKNNPHILGRLALDNGNYMMIRAGSRKRWLTRDFDNFGFAKFVQENAEELFKLGEGRHFGEWWGNGIQRTYDMDTKVFSLFNVHRWKQVHEATVAGLTDAFPSCCSVVPLLRTHSFDPIVIQEEGAKLMEGGSVAAPGYMKPEGVVVYLPEANYMYKVSIDNGDLHKGESNVSV